MMNHAHGWIGGWSAAMWLMVVIGAGIVGALIVVAMKRQAKKSRR